VIDVKDSTVQLVACAGGNKGVRAIGVIKIGENKKVIMSFDSRSKGMLELLKIIGLPLSLSFSFLGFHPSKSP
jgi:hypothetical protein